jgi:hypothetical protein
MLQAAAGSGAIAADPRLAECTGLDAGLTLMAMSFTTDPEQHS